MPPPPIHDVGLDGKPLAPRLKGELAKKFLLPPFTVLNAREGEWQSRKKAWIRLGIRSELGRGANVLGHSEQSGNIDFYAQKRKLEKELGKTLTTQEAGEILKERGVISELSNDVAGMDSAAGRSSNLLGLSKSAEDYRRGRGNYAKDLDHARKRTTPGGGGGPNTKYNRGAKKPEARAFNIGMNANKENGWSVEDNQGSGTSIFDPVLCELLYEWFSPPGGIVLDPFSGGSVRGIVAACLGRKYWGCDLSAAQVEANKAQLGIVPHGCPLPKWHVGDACEMVPTRAPEADFVIACPPYFDLEVYSEDPRDLSVMDWDGFRAVYDDIVGACAARLRPDRFAAFVVGDVRDDNGLYRNLPGYTTACFRRAGMSLYNEMQLITAVGSLSIRTERQFVMSRKLGRTHQTVLVYVKGDPRRATDAVTGMGADARRAMLLAQAEERKAAVSGWEE